MNHLDNQLNSLLGKFGVADNTAFNCLWGTPTCNKLTGECFCDTGQSVSTVKPIPPLSNLDYNDYCSKLPAPQGSHYEYIFQKGCVLVPNSNSQQSIEPVVIGEPNSPVFFRGESVFPTSQNLRNFLTENKLLVLGVAGVLGYMFLSGGLGASDRTVTSITRYSPRKKNGLKRRKR